MEKYSSFQQEAKHLKKLKKWQKPSAQTESFLQQVTRAHTQVSSDLVMLLTLFGLSGKHKGKEKN